MLKSHFIKLIVSKLFGGSIKKQNEFSSDKEELLSDIKENKPGSL